MTATRAAQDGGVIAKMDRARLALREAKTIQDTKQIVDVARAAEVYARQQKLGDEAIGYAHAIKIEALRRLGEMLRESPKAKGVRLAGRDALGCTKVEQPKDDTPTLADLGIDRKVSAVASGETPMKAGPSVELAQQSVK